MRQLLTRYGWRRLRLPAMAAFTMVLAIALTACGDDSDESGDSGGGGSIVEEAQEQVDAAMNPTTEWPGPNESVEPPAEPQTLGIVPCGPFEGCLEAAGGAEEAAEALGWESNTVTPTEGTPQEVNGIFRRLIDSGVDAISWVGLPRSILEPSLQLAEENGIPAVSAQSAEGSELDVPYGEPDAPFELLGEQIAWWMIEDSNGEAKVAILSDDEFVTGVQIDKGFERVMGECPDCEIVTTTDITAAEESTKAATETANILARNPEVNYLFAPFDSRVPFMVQGARQAQRDDVSIGSTGISDPEMMLQDSPVKLDVSNALPEGWTGWATVDQILRIMADRPLVESYDIPVKLVTEENVEEPFFRPLSNTNIIDYPSEFKRLWGVG